MNVIKSPEFVKRLKVDESGLIDILSMLEVKTAIIEGLKTSISDCIPENEIQW